MLKITNDKLRYNYNGSQISIGLLNVGKRMDEQSSNAIECSTSTSAHISGYW